MTSRELATWLQNPYFLCTFTSLTKSNTISTFTSPATSSATFNWEQLKIQLSIMANSLPKDDPTTAGFTVMKRAGIIHMWWTWWPILPTNACVQQQKKCHLHSWRPDDFLVGTGQATSQTFQRICVGHCSTRDAVGDSLPLWSRS